MGRLRADTILMLTSGILLLAACSDSDSGVDGVGGGAGSSGSTGGNGAQAGGGGTANQGGSGGTNLGGSGGTAQAGSGGTSQGGADGGSAGALCGDPSVLFNSNIGFESGSFLGEWRISSGGDPTTISEVVGSPSPVRVGNYSMHLVAQVDYRNEMVPNENVDPSPGLYEWGEEYWLGTSLYLKDYTINPVAWSTLVQTHAIPSANPDGTTNWGCCAGDNGWTLHTSGTTLGFHARVVPDHMTAIPTCAAVNQDAWSIEIPDNQWLDFVVHWKHSLDSDGFVEMWFNGQKVVEIASPNVHYLDVCGLPRKQQTVLQTGIYKEREATDVTRELFMDEVRIAGAGATYEDVAPGQNCGP